MEYLVHVLIIFAIYAILAISLDMIVGYSGIISFSHAAFYAIGAYVGAICYLRFELNMIVAMIIAFVITGIVGAISYVLLSRLKEDYLILSFFALHEVIIGIIHNWQSITNGPAGLFGILRPTFFGYTFVSNISFLVLVTAVLIIVLTILLLWKRSPWGVMAQGVRDDDLLMSTLGYNVKLIKIINFAIGVGFAGIAGVLYAHFVGYVSPIAFSIGLAVTVFTFVFIGGPASLYGPILGTALMVALPEILRIIGIPDSYAGHLQQIIYGVLLVLLVFIRPQGFFGKYKVA
ncbi:branched-chain amino acid ABC transporter permease [Bacillus sp. Marseille-P3661]|uniref:branched-chain amino acid ABC transporter permease n=1 Tax=Bacillus sp. Marseille-P3661 TaxID=1936234 RepID=UPI000C818DE7|nr:branched-chain amino acid ABC transporter permease [Bacillus sp. Marseille-P3661]